MSTPTETNTTDVFEARVTPTGEGDPMRGSARLFVGYFASMSTLVGDIVGEDVDHLFDGHEHHVSLGAFLLDVAPLPTLAQSASIDSIFEALDLGEDDPA